MRFPDENARRLTAGLLLVSTAALAACGPLGGGSDRPVASVTMPVSANGPQADYPVVIGDPYDVAGVTYTPSDTLNYDEVGYALPVAGEGVSAAHHTLPVPSYVEITSLVSGRTILARIEQRGPMGSTHLIGLSPAALLQLEGGADTPVRVRRVNPPEEQRAMLRGGQPAPLRMDTPMSLVEVLKRRLPAEGSASLRADADVPASPVTEPEPVVEVAVTEDSQGTPEAPPRIEETPVFAAAETFDEAFEPGTDLAEATPPAAPAPTTAPAAEANFVVQAASFSTEERARRAAEPLDGIVSQAGRYWRVRTGPFATRSEAEASLAKVRAAGYTDARIQNNG